MATTASRCSGRWPASPPLTVSRSPAWMRPRSATRISSATSPRCSTRKTQAMVIAIDGPAGAGKSSVARGVAAELGFTYLDSGAMYRCVARLALDAGVDLDDPEALGALAAGARIGFEGDRVLLEGDEVSEAIREPAVTEASSRVSVHAPVREALVAAQRRLI